MHDEILFLNCRGVATRVRHLADCSPDSCCIMSQNAWRGFAALSPTAIWCTECLDASRSSRSGSDERNLNAFPNRQAVWKLGDHRSSVPHGGFDAGIHIDPTCLAGQRNSNMPEENSESTAALNFQEVVHVNRPSGLPAELLGLIVSMVVADCLHAAMRSKEVSTVRL